MSEERPGYDIHEEADATLDEQEAAETDHRNVLYCLVNLQWVVSAAQHRVAEHPLCEHDQVHLIELVLSATERQIEILGL